MNELITRDQWRSYLGVKGAGNVVTYHLIGEGFTDLSESKNPKEYSRKYVHERSERSDVTGYAPSLAYSTDVYSEDPVVLEIIDITDNELVGTDAQRDVVSVNLWKPIQGQASKFEATKRTYAVIPDSKGSGSDAMVYSGNFKASGDPVFGAFDVTTKTFTAN